MEHQLVVINKPPDDQLQDLFDEFAAGGWTLLAHAVRRRKHWLTFGRSGA